MFLFAQVIHVTFVGNNIVHFLIHFVAFLSVQVSPGPPEWPGWLVLNGIY